MVTLKAMFFLGLGLNDDAILTGVVKQNSISRCSCKHCMLKAVG